MTARAEFDGEFEGGEVGIFNHGFEAEAECILIDSRHLADAEADFAGILSWVAGHLDANGVEHRICNSHLVHNRSSSIWQRLKALLHSDRFGMPKGIPWCETPACLHRG
ncbi:MAG: hypothetical protein ABSD53_01395 [Terriglobales bacterium]|jgi:hypothetical protein